MVWDHGETEVSARGASPAHVCAGTPSSPSPIVGTTPGGRGAGRSAGHPRPTPFGAGTRSAGHPSPLTSVLPSSPPVVPILLHNRRLFVNLDPGTIVSPGIRAIRDPSLASG